MQNGHILLIDDDEDEYMIFLMALQEIEAFNKCSYSKTISEAFNLFRYALPDLIFLDMNMPGVNGLECLTEIKKIEALNGTAVFLYTTYLSDAIIKRALSLGAAGCIRKPRVVGGLVQLLKPILNADDVKTICPSPEKSKEKSNLFRPHSLTG